MSKRMLAIMRPARPAQSSARDDRRGTRYERTNLQMMFVLFRQKEFRVFKQSAG